MEVSRKNFEVNVENGKKYEFKKQRKMIWNRISLVLLKFIMNAIN